MRAGFRGDCHETFVVSRGRVVGDGGRAGVDVGVIRVADEGVVSQSHTSEQERGVFTPSPIPGS